LAAIPLLGVVSYVCGMDPPRRGDYWVMFALSKSDQPGRMRTYCRHSEHTMASRLNPYLSFAGDTRKAMEFYQGVFGGELNMTTFGEFGMNDPGVADGIMHANLMAADVPPNMEHKPGNNITISLSGDDGADLRGYWEKLSQGGTVAMPLEKQSWGDEFGMCIDRFGIPWMVNISEPAE
jgi:PhnB protein